MKTKQDVYKKRDKLRSNLRKATFKYGKRKDKNNCKYWVDKVQGPSKCVYNAQNGGGEYRDCTGAESCPVFTCKYTEADLNEKYLTLLQDPAYLARNYPALSILDWMLEETVVVVPVYKKWWDAVLSWLDYIVRKKG